MLRIYTIVSFKFQLDIIYNLLENRHDERLSKNRLGCRFVSRISWMMLTEFRRPSSLRLGPGLHENGEGGLTKECMHSFSVSS